MSRSYIVHYCMLHIVPWWYAPMHNKVWLCQRTKNLSNVINPINLTLMSKIKVVSGSWMCLTHPLMVIDPCANYGTLMSKLTEVTDMSQTLKIWHKGQSSKSYLDHDCTRHIVLWWYTHVPSMVTQCQSKTRGPWATSLTWEQFRSINTYDYINVD